MQPEGLRTQGLGLVWLALLVLVRLVGPGAAASSSSSRVVGVLGLPRGTREEEARAAAVCSAG